MYGAMISLEPAETGYLQSPIGSPSLNAITIGVTAASPLNQRSTWKRRPPHTRSPVVPTTTIWPGPSASIVGLKGGLQAATGRDDPSMPTSTASDAKATIRRRTSSVSLARNQAPGAKDATHWLTERR